MQIANGKIPSVINPRGLINEEVLYLAESNTVIDYLHFANNSTMLIELTLKIQYLENYVLLTPNNYKLDLYDKLIFDKQIHLKEFEKIVATASADKKIDFYINGTAEPVEEHTEMIDINEFIPDESGIGGEGYGGPYGDPYGE